MEWVSAFSLRFLIASDGATVDYPPPPEGGRPVYKRTVEEKHRLAASEMADLLDHEGQEVGEAVFLDTLAGVADNGK